MAAIRLRLLTVPLQRDEGDYAYIAQLLLQGVAPYTEAYDMRMPRRVPSAASPGVPAR